MAGNGDTADQASSSAPTGSTAPAHRTAEVASPANGTPTGNAHARTVPFGTSSPWAAQESAATTQALPSIEAALTDGEDYELLFVLGRETDPKIFARKWRQVFPRTSLTCLGRFVPATRADPDALDFQRYHGYEHLR